MNVKKSDMISVSADISLTQKEAMQRQLQAADLSKSASAPVSIDVDSLRAQVLTLQNEAKELQTKISFHQVQLAFLSELKDKTNWKNELMRFMQNHFPTFQDEGSPEESLEDFMARTENRLGELSNNLIKKEVQLQNILSSGMLPEESLTIKLFRDLAQDAEVFRKLKPELVSNLLKS
ncbi:MAG: hypothetical protein NZM25_03975 [Leptospiraceae bacterium]|nr:hypothetical protein [Leptospiraceae bacterium]MDW8306144.1 hypothetical protein [Leptospiraceae bacterium]